MLCAKVEDVGRIHAHFNPTVVGFRVARGVFVSFEAGEIQPVLIDPEPLFIRQEFPGVSDGILLEVIAERPVAEHFEKRAVGAVAHFVDVAGAHAFLHINQAAACRVRFAHQVRHKRMHTRRGKEHGGVVFRNQRGRGDHGMPAFTEKPEIELAQLFGSQILHSFIPHL